MMLFFAFIGSVFSCWSMEQAIIKVSSYLCDENYTISPEPPYDALGDFGDEYWKCKPGGHYYPFCIFISDFKTSCRLNLFTMTNDTPN
jgi:hypothetical protein